MAQRALPPGASVRRRTAWGLFDADGWTWGTIKATFWFFTIIFLLGYLPDRAYYFTVSPTIDVGYNVVSPINLCDARNRGLPCPAPHGATIPWQEGGEGIILPQPRTAASAFNVSENIYIAGGQTPEGVTASVLGTILQDDNLTGWSEAAQLPEPRADAVAVISGGVPYVIGGVDADGNPTSTVFRGIIEEGALSGWEDLADLALPVALTDASAVATGRGIYVFGGLVDGQPSSTVYVSELGDGESPQPGPWTEVTELPLPEPRAGATAVLETNAIYVLGGYGPDGMSNLVFYLGLDEEGAPLADEGTGQAQGWGVSVGQASDYALPEPRQNHASFANGGAIYVIGGEGPGETPATTHYWAVADPETGTFDGWNRLQVNDLPRGIQDAQVIALGSNAYLFGGETAEGVTDGVMRANLAPALPFFRLGLFGVTVPGLGIPGEIGQELGLIVSAGAGTTLFIVLLIVGFAYSHPRGTMRAIERVSRGRFRAPPEDEDRARA
ncbi:MAG TPA: hypothetical protein VM305_06110 [Candidatus Limnocylindrales bacterium]|nr:hypothetical protein [Candidatus Limnocylindrales bacterium]